MSVGGKFVRRYGEGANLIGTKARLVSSVKCSRPSRVLVRRPESTKSSTATLGSSGRTMNEARFVPGPPLVAANIGLVKSIILVSHVGPLVLQDKPLVKKKLKLPTLVTSWTELATGQLSTCSSYLPRLAA